MKNLLPTILVLLLLSCQADLESIEMKKSFKFDIVEGKSKVTLPVDNTTLSHSLVYDFFIEDERAYLVWVNTRNNDILLYDIELAEVVYKVNVPREGDQGIKKIAAIEMIDKYNAFIVINYGGDVIKYDLKEKKRGEKFEFFPSSSNGNYILNSPCCRPVLVKGRLYACAENELNTYTDNELLYERSPVGVFLDLKTGVVDYGGMKNYPSSYSNVFYPAEFWNYSRDIVGDGNFVYSFSCDHHVYLENIENGEVSSFFCKSQNLPEVWPENPARDEYTDVRYKIETGIYESIIYDKFRDLYYRIYRCDGSVENPNDIYRAMKEFRLRKVGVMVLNKNFDIIVDKKLENIYFSPAYFVAPDGLYISTENPASETLNENIMVFSRIDVVPK